MHVSAIQGKVLAMKQSIVKIDRGKVTRHVHKAPG